MDLLYQFYSKNEHHIYKIRYKVVKLWNIVQEKIAFFVSHNKKWTCIHYNPFHFISKITLFQL